MPPAKFELPAGMSAVTLAENDEGQVMSVAVSVPYSRPFGSYIFLIRCNYNPDIENCLENKLTRDPQFESWEAKCELLTTFIDENISKFESISDTVTGITFRSRLTGPPYVCTYEDLSHSLIRISMCHVRFHPFVHRSRLNLRTTDIFGTFPRYDEAEIEGKRCIFRRHDFAWDNHNFQYEIIAHEKGISQVPHVLPISSLVFKGFEVEGAVLPSCGRGSIEYLLRYHQNEIPLSRVSKWLSQIAHSLMEIHSRQLSHGNLNSGTIFVDENWDAHLTGFKLENGYRSALGGDPTPEKLLAWDVLSLGNVMEEFVANDFQQDASTGIGMGDTKATCLELAKRCSEVMKNGKAWDILGRIARLADCGCIGSEN